MLGGCAKTLVLTDVRYSLRDDLVVVGLDVSVCPPMLPLIEDSRFGVASPHVSQTLHKGLSFLRDVL